MLEDLLSFDPPTHFPHLQRRAVPELPEPVSSEPVPTRPATPEPDVPELDIDQSTASESDGPETDDEDYDSEFEEDIMHDSGYEDGLDSEFEDQEFDDESEEEDQDFESGYEADDSEPDTAGSAVFEPDDAHSFTGETQPVQGYSAEPNRRPVSRAEHDFILFEVTRSHVRHLPTDEEAKLLPITDKEIMTALRRSSAKLRLLRLELEKHEARTGVRTEPVIDVSHSDVHAAPDGFVIDVSHLDVHNEQPPKPAAVSPLAGQKNELVRCHVSLRWWLTEREHAEYSIPLLLYVAACDYAAVLAGAALCATLRTVARALSSPGTVTTQPLDDFPFAWLAYAPLVTVVSVALDSVLAREWEPVRRALGCRSWAPLPVFRLRRRWAGARRRFVNVGFSLFVVLSLVHTAAV
ncbi:hypothetical protein MY11210_008950 [Beauveria gryllotalpidicola]